MAASRVLLLRQHSELLGREGGHHLLMTGRANRQRRWFDSPSQNDGLLARWHESCEIKKDFLVRRVADLKIGL